MNLPKASLHLGLSLALACPLAGYAQGGDAGSPASSGEAPILQLAAAIGIVKPAPEPEPVPAPAPAPVPEPAPPAAATPPPATEQTAASTPEPQPEADTATIEGVTSGQILVGVGVAALIGILAGGGGGGSSSTPTHNP